MRKISPIKVKLIRGFGSGADKTYFIKQVIGAVTLGAYNGQVLRVGDTIDEKQAERLTQSYLVTVSRK